MMNCPHGKMVVRSEEYFQGLFKREAVGENIDLVDFAKT